MGFGVCLPNVPLCNTLTQFLRVLWGQGINPDKLTESHGFAWVVFVSVARA